MPCLRNHIKVVTQASRATPSGSPTSPPAAHLQLRRFFSTLRSPECAEATFAEPRARHDKAVSQRVVGRVCSKENLQLTTCHSHAGTGCELRDRGDSPAVAWMPMRRGGLSFVDPVSRISVPNGNREDDVGCLVYLLDFLLSTQSWP